MPDFPEVARHMALSAYRRPATANFSASTRLTLQEDVIAVESSIHCINFALHEARLGLKILVQSAFRPKDMRANHQS
jgi:hypothetical protein